MEFGKLMMSHFSKESDDEGVKLASAPEKAPPGDISIDLSDYEEDEESLARITQTITKRRTGSFLSTENSMSLSANEFNPATLRLLNKPDRIRGIDNLVVNGEYLPDVVNKARADAHVKIISAKTTLAQIEKDIIYYVNGNDDDNRVYKFLKGEGLFVANTPQELASVIEDFRHSRPMA